MQVVTYMVAAIVVGALVAAQPPLNAMLARSIGSAYGATAINIIVALMTILAIIAVFGAGTVNRETLTAVPWWAYLAGFFGAIFVAAGVIIAPVTGALVFFVCLIAGQLIGSTLLDHFGAFRLEVREISIWRVIGVVLVLTGAVMVSRG